MASPVVAFVQLANELEAEGLSAKAGERIAAELAKTFNVHADEVAILKIEKLNLTFIYPAKLSNVGSIPLNTGSSVAARTATAKRAEIINNFAQTKHASVFEAVGAAGHPKTAEEKGASVIQKLMTVPVIGPAGVLGVIQISRKGTNAPAAGADFTPMDLQKLNTIAASLVKCFK